MPAPPPPPQPPPVAPPPPPPPSAPLPQCPLEPPKLQFCGGGGGGGGGGRNALLADIQKGTKLKKVTQVNDRSAPVVNNSKASTGDVCGNAGAPQASSGGTAPVGPSLSGLFAAGFPTLRPIGQRDLAGKTKVSRSSSSVSLKPLWNPPSSADSGSFAEPDRKVELQTSINRLLAPSASAPPSPSNSSKHPLPFPASTPPLPAPPSAPLPLHASQDRPSNKPPPLPSCPPPPPPPQSTKPTWLPIQHSQHTSVTQPSPTLPPPPPPPAPPTFQPLSAVPGDRSSGCFYPPPSPVVYPETSRFPIPRDSPLGPPPPPPPPPLPPSFTPTCPSTLPPPPPKVAPVPSPAMRTLPPSYPCNAPTRRPPAVPRNAGVGRLVPPPAPPARSPTTELSTRIPPPPPPPPALPPPPPPPALPPSSLRNGHLHSLADDFESKFQFHPVEDLPPPDEFKPFPRIYPSKENRVNLKPPGIRTHLR